MTMIVVMGVKMPEPMMYTTLVAYIVLMAKEFLVGLMLGFIAFILISALYIAGQLIDMRIGFGMVNVFDPVSNIQIPITADFYIILATMFMLVTDGHHLIILTLAQSYQVLPIGKMILSTNLIEQFIRMLIVIFEIGFKIAAPVTVAILVTDMALGIISKSIPQMNVFMLGMPIKVLLGLVVVFLTLASFHGAVTLIMEGTIKEMKGFLINAGGSP
jgi:flagellar biosynthetic protein FliR